MTNNFKSYSTGNLELVAFLNTKGHKTDNTDVNGHRVFFKYSEDLDALAHCVQEFYEGTPTVELPAFLFALDLARTQVKSAKMIAMGPKERK